MTLLSPGQIRAGRRPFVILAIALSRLGLGLCLASPLASLVGESGVGQRAEGDRALFEGGGYLLLEVVRLQGPAVAAALRGLLPVLALGLVLTALGNAALLLALSTEGKLRGLSWLSPAFARLPALCVVGVGTALGQGLVLLLAALLADGVPSPLAAPRQTSLLQATVWLAALGGAGALGGLADVTKAALVRDASPLFDALGRAARATRRMPVSSLFGWVPYAGPFALAALCAAWLAGAVDVSLPGAWRVVLVFAGHQAVVVVAVACRAAWFARALRVVSTTP